MTESNYYSLKIVFINFILFRNYFKEDESLIEFVYCYVFLAISIIYFIVTNDKYQKQNEYPNGMELLEELKEIELQEINVCTFNFERIDPYIFREYVYRYEIIGGDSRKIALIRAFESYRKDYL